MLSGGEVAGLIIAVFWAILVCFLAYVLIKVGKVLKETAKLVSGVTDQTVPLLGEVTATVTSTNAQLARVDTIASHVESITANVSGLASIFAATLGTPVVKVAAFSYGVRRAVSDRRRRDMGRRVRAEMRAEIRSEQRVLRSGRRGRV
jgi:uncharacterized protein YoxC